MIGISQKIRRFRPLNFGRPKLPFSIAANVRIAQVTPTAFPFDSVEIFHPDCWHKLETYRPGIVIGTAADLQLLVQVARWNPNNRLEKRGLDLSSVDRAIFVLTEVGGDPLTDVLRVVLWQTFGVPVYEVLTGTGGRVLAAECEAYEGWHIDNSAEFSVFGDELVFRAPGQNPVPTGLTGFIETQPCACGRRGSRLMSLETFELQEAPRQLAATA